MNKKTQFTRSKVKMGSMSWTSPIYPHGEGKYQNKVFRDNIPGYPGYHISKRGKIYSRWSINGKGILSKREIQRSYIPRLINLGFTRKEVSEIMGLGVQLISDYYNKYKETYG